MDIDLAAFPTTRFQGSKRKIIPWLYEVFSDLEFESALDIFGGTATVSYLLKQMGKRVAYNDLLYFNYLIGLAIIENDSVRLGSEFQLRPPPRSRVSSHRFVQQHFSGFYFTDYENAWIDRAVFSLASLGGQDIKSAYKRAIGFYALFQACLIKRPFNLFHRKNLYLRTATVQRSFGNKRAWDRPMALTFRRFLREANEAVFSGAQKCTANNFDAQEFPVRDFDLVYIDAPYVSATKDIETADYRTCYHFLEGLSRYQEWGNLLDHTSSILSLKRQNENPFTCPRRNKAALRNVFERFENSVFVISYKKFGAPSISWFTKELKRLGKHVSCQTRHYKYALNHQNGDAALNREVIIIAR